MAIKDGIQVGQQNTDELTMSGDINPRLGVTTSQFVIVEDPNIIQDGMKDDLYHSVKTGDGVRTSELTGQQEDTRRPDPSGIDRVQTETTANGAALSFEDSERKRLDDLSRQGFNPAPGTENTDGVSSFTNPLGLATGLSLKHHLHRPPVTTADAWEAAINGDYTALAQIQMANFRRELFEHTDVNGDGSMPGHTPSFISGLFSEDQYGLFHSDGTFHDKFGGYYDSYGGYEFKDGSYTSATKSHYNAATNQVTLADGSVRKPPPQITTPAQMKSMMHLDSQVTAFEHGADPKLATTSAAAKRTAAARAPAAGLSTSGPATTQNDAGVANVVIANRAAAGTSMDAPLSKPEWQKAHDQFFAQQQEQQQRAKQYQSERGTAGDASLTAVSETDATAKIGHVHVPTAAPTKDGAAAPDAASKDGAPTTWYADTKNNGYWDDQGGYYDNKGGYWDNKGGYWDPTGGYTDPAGGHTWADGSYLDPKGTYVDNAGNLWTADGAKYDKQQGVDYIAQLKEAAKNNTTYTPTAVTPSTAPIVTIDADDAPLSAAPVTATAASAVTSVDASVTNQIVANRLSSPANLAVTPTEFTAAENNLRDQQSAAVKTPVPDVTSPGALPILTTVATPASSVTTIGGVSANLDLSKYATLDLTAPTTTPTLTDADFSSMFNDFRTTLVDNRTVKETKFFDGLTPTTSLLGPSSTLSLTAPVSLAPVDVKPIVIVPKVAAH